MRVSRTDHCRVQASEPISAVSYLYIEWALIDAIPAVRHEIAKDLKAYIDLVVSETLKADDNHVVAAQ